LIRQAAGYHGQVPVPDVVAPSRPGGNRSTLSRLGGVARLDGPAVSRLGPSLAVSALALCAVVIFRRQLFDHWTFPWDFVGGYTATPAFVSALLGSGHLVSWSPFVASGFPVDVDPQAGLYFPGWWALGGLGVPATLRVVTAVQVAHVLFGSVGVLLLARARRLEWSWAMVAAIAYLFFGGFYGEAEHADIVRGFAYVPWLLWALTPPVEARSWWRLAAVPPLAWLIASGAYPAQIVSFGITGFVYVSVALWASGPEVWRRYRVPLALAVVAAGGVCVAVLLPYLRAEHAHQLYRVRVPTAAVRAEESIAPRDLLGLYLNNFAWVYDGTVTAWAVGIPILIGLACVKLEALRRHAPLVACGALALALAMTPRIGFVGRAMVSVPSLFPSRFPAADYKAVVAIALVVLGAEAWRQPATRHRGVIVRAGLAGALLLGGALLAPSNYGQPTGELWLVVGVVLACVTLVLLRMPPRFLVFLLIILVAVDGAREIHDYRFQGKISPWQESASAAAPYRARDGYVRKLPKLFEQAPPSRPARQPPYASLVTSPTGRDPDATGWLAEGYHLIDYGGTIERVLWQAEHNPTWVSLLLAPWHGFTFSCVTVGCEKGVRLPIASSWHPSPDVQTLSYGPQRIVYSVNVSQPVLMVENELAISGWHADTPRVLSVDAGIPLRAWRLAPGRYRFTTSFQEPGRTPQELAVLVALAAWLGCALELRRRGITRSRVEAVSSPISAQGS
jgi:hypothetical protein